jgi:hypothetical protein
MVVRRGQIRRIGWVVKTLEAQVGQFLLGCKCPVSSFLPVWAKDLSAPSYNYRSAYDWRKLQTEDDGTSSTRLRKSCYLQQPKKTSSWSPIRHIWWDTWLSSACVGRDTKLKRHWTARIYWDRNPNLKAFNGPSVLGEIHNCKGIEPKVAYWERKPALWFVLKHKRSCKGTEPPGCAETETQL